MNGLENLETLFLFIKIIHTMKIDIYYFAVKNGPAQLGVAGVSVDEIFCAICNI